MLYAAFLILTAGFVGESSAVYALYAGHDDPSTRRIVLAATLVLLFAVVTGPLIAYIRVTLTLQHGRGSAPEQDSGPQAPVHPPTSPQAPGASQPSPNPGNS
jgi:hypothetical protein